jgi:hypothetical protein
MDTQTIVILIVINSIAAALNLLASVVSSSIADRVLHGVAAIGFTLATGFYVAML